MASLLDRLKSVGSISSAGVLSESVFFNNTDMVQTELPILNIAFSGSVDGGMPPGLTILAGMSKSYKTLLALYCMKAYFNKFPDAIALLYDSEFGITPEYLRMHGIDPARIIHIPIEHVEQLKFDIVKRLEEIDRKDHVFIMIDSLGAISSKKEVDDAKDEKSVSDMTRAKAIRSLLRLITPHLTIKDIPLVAINHVYSTMEMFSKTVVGGGTAVMYSANMVFIITRSQEKDKDGLNGWNFTINIEKSRYVREKSKLVFYVDFEDGISKYSGMQDLGIEFGCIKQSGAWYQVIDFETGAFADKKIRAADITSEFYDLMLKDEKFKKFIQDKYQLNSVDNIQLQPDVLEDIDEDLG